MRIFSENPITIRSDHLTLGYDVDVSPNAQVMVHPY